MATQLVTTCAAFSGGAAGDAGQGQTVRLTFGGTWALDETYLFVAVFNATGIAERFGVGDLSNKDMNFLLTYNQKQNVLAGQSWYFSEVDSDIDYNNPDGVGNGTVLLANSQGISEDLVALAPFQNKMAVFCPNSTQIWNTGASQDSYGKAQVLQGVGTNSPLSVQGLGELDVVFMQGGFRSLMARKEVLVADPSDIGTPIDMMVLELLDAGASEAGVCSVIEPKTNRYWGFVGSKIFVLSYFPQSKVVAWSTFLAKASTCAGLKGTSFGIGGSFLHVTVVGRVYYLEIGNATLVTNGSQNIVASGYFVAESATTSFNGPVSTAFTGELHDCSSFTTFVPTKMVVQDSVVYIRGSDNKIYAYGGASGLLYDCTQAIGQIPWLADNMPMTQKQFAAIDVAMRGKWLIECGADPTSGVLQSIWNGGSATSPNTQIDSTFDSLAIPCEIQGTHFTLKFTSSLNSYKMCRFSGLNVLYQTMETT